MPAPKMVDQVEMIDVRYVDGALPRGEFIGGLPLDGSTISVPATIAQAWIEAGIAKPANKATAQAANEREFE